MDTQQPRSAFVRVLEDSRKTLIILATLALAIGYFVYSDSHSVPWALAFMALGFIGILLYVEYLKLFYKTPRTYEELKGVSLQL